VKEATSTKRAETVNYGQHQTRQVDTRQIQLEIEKAQRVLRNPDTKARLTHTTLKTLKADTILRAKGNVKNAQI
jgi:hypothetical protein